MNKLHVLLLVPVVFFAMLFVYSKVGGPIPVAVSSVVTQKGDAFTVMGEGKTTISPDMAVVTVGVQTTGTTVKASQDDLNNRINAVSTAIKGLGIPEADIQTSNYSIYPNYDFQGTTQRITGYNASSNLVIKVKDLDKTNDVIDRATAEGANTVSGVTFEVQDKEKAHNEARQQAVDDAKRKAQEAARIAGFNLGKIVNYSENFGGGVQPPMPMMARDVANQELKTQVEPGSQEILVNVSLSYEIR
jgi:uncharacterized protein